MASIEEIARAYWRTEETRNVDGVLDHFAPDAVWLGPGGIELRGHGQIRRFYEDTGRDFPGLEVVVVGVVGDDRAAAIEWNAVLIDSDGVRHPARGVNVMEGDGQRITALHAYYDRAEIGLAIR